MKSSEKTTIERSLSRRRVRATGVARTALPAIRVVPADSNRSVSADLFVFPSSAGSTGAFLTLPATSPTAALLPAAALLAATLLPAALPATGPAAALLPAATLLAATLAATLAALCAQFGGVVIPIVIKCAIAIPVLWSFHGSFPISRRMPA
jgi:hypothetical protein